MREISVENKLNLRFLLFRVLVVLVTVPVASSDHKNTRAIVVCDWLYVKGFSLPDIRSLSCVFIILLARYVCHFPFVRNCPQNPGKNISYFSYSGHTTVVELVENYDNSLCTEKFFFSSTQISFWMTTSTTTMMNPHVVESGRKMRTLTPFFSTCSRQPATLEDSWRLTMYYVAIYNRKTTRFLISRSQVLIAQLLFPVRLILDAFEREILPFIARAAARNVESILNCSKAVRCKTMRWCCLSRSLGGIHLQLRVSSDQLAGFRMMKTAQSSRSIL